MIFFIFFFAFVGIEMGSSYFSLGQWQELELQALIYRHFTAGAPVPPELLHLVKKSIITSPSSYYFSHPFQQYPHYQQTCKLLSFFSLLGKIIILSALHFGVCVCVCVLTSLLFSWFLNIWKMNILPKFLFLICISLSPLPMF